MSKLYDSLIVGDGPAGLSAALGLARVHRTCAVFSQSTYRNDGIQASHSLLTQDHVAPAEIRRLGRRDIARYGNAEFFDNTSVTSVEKKTAGSGNSNDDVVTEFEVADVNGKKWRGSTLILAMGCKDVFPEIEGFGENWPENIFQCPFCDGHERSALPKGILALTRAAFVESIKTASLVHYQSFPAGADHHLARAGGLARSPVTIFTNGFQPAVANADEDAGVARVLATFAALGIAVDTRPIARFEPASRQKQQLADAASTTSKDVGLYVHFTAPSAASAPPPPPPVYLGFVLYSSTTTLVSPDLLAALNIATVPTPAGPKVAVAPPFNAVPSCPGVFVAGDAITPATQVVAAMASGLFAGAGAAFHCAARDNQLAVEAAAAALAA